MKIFLILFFLTTIIQAKDKDLRLESTIYYALIKELTHSQRPKIYLADNVLSIQKFSSRFNLVKNCENANIIIVTHIKNIDSECKDKILFGTKYQTLDNKSVVGAFFWQKGRPNILFYQTRLTKYGIQLSKHFTKYIDNEK